MINTEVLAALTAVLTVLTVSKIATVVFEAVRMAAKLANPKTTESAEKTFLDFKQATTTFDPDCPRFQIL